MTDGHKFLVFDTAITQAVQRGYEPSSYLTMLQKIYMRGEFSPAYKPLIISWGYFNIIFSHSFAAAFFGLEWRHHLRTMVVYREPLEYLERFL